jgi:peptide/nickel transport system permease protein
MTAPAAPSPRAPARRNSFAARATRSPALMIGIIMVALCIVMAIFAPWLSPYDPDAQDVIDKLAGSSAQHWLGTDSFGRDTLSRIIWGSRVSLFVSFLSTIAGVVVGTLIGVDLGLLRRLVRSRRDGHQRRADELPADHHGHHSRGRARPEPVQHHSGDHRHRRSPAFVRIARGSTLAMKERDFVDACRALGFPTCASMFAHVLPNIMDEVVVMASLWLATAIRTEATLAFIGLGAPPPTATWGGIVREGFENLLDAPMLPVWPSIAILIVMIGLNLIGDGLRDATDPRAPT